MIKTILFIFILIHGLIHLLGFVKGFDLVNTSNFSGKALFPLSKDLGHMLAILWLAACVCFLLSGTAILLRKEWWWMLATIAIILSQVLVIIYWKDARFGTVANILLLPVIIVSFANWSFNKMVAMEVKGIMAYAPPNDHKTITPEMTERLPYCVQKWLLRSGAVGKQEVHKVYLKQRGAMCTEPGGKWLPMEAEQYFTIDRPAFIWRADVQMKPFVKLAARDKYENGRGNMLIKALALIPVVNAGGKA